MRKRFLLALLCLTPTLGSAAEPHLQTPVEKFSYALGLQFAQNLSRQGITRLDPQALALAVQDILGGTPPRLSFEDMKAAQVAYREALQQEQRERARRNLEDGKQFLAANASRDGVVSLDSGVQYRVLKAGDGQAPALDDTVVVNYRGRLLDGREFDSSYSRNEPLTIALNGVIPGWQQVVTRMQPGGSVEAWIPADQGYGERGAGAVIGPNATLHFTIDLLEVQGQ